jgi:heme oxygenase (biliverdin-IX-beta and delta-forming)
VRPGALPSRGHAHLCLRAKTRTLHASLAALLMASNLGSRPAYERYLLTNSPLAWIEPALTHAGIQQLLPDWGRRQRYSALAADLNELGICGGPSYACVIDADYGTLLGWGYVLEGSRLGARLIRPMVEATGDQELVNAIRFLRHGENEEFWTFTEALAQIDQDEGAIAKAGIAAQIAFGCFLRATA